ncbi:aminofutalosine deaminase family hydrolase [Caminibacter mediatlanticus]|uniref:Chlorohydrolase n=1 Tax=Caminibacter mediatlanticus TB-2 TaxID=391592 RepID=A0AAI9AIA1_9BACT|nr:metal-dependent hydrolase [Caminibacter mediatlanticus]EDM23979.1 chlorohydrolase [Caminibacter mediatlanticus TB-2]
MIKLKADYVLTMDSKYSIIKNGEIIFDEKIIDIGINLQKTKKEVYLGKNSVIMPALINSHTHLEFSHNKTLLKYGDFIIWLDSVIENREELFINCKGECYKKAIQEMKESGVCAYGEISSTGDDLRYIKHSPLKVVYFNEIIGTNPAVVDMLYQDFLARFEESLKLQNEKFKVGVSIHSPYSVHPILMEKVINLAKINNLPIQTHFMESKAERSWLDKGEGEFKLFFEKNFKNAKPLISPIEFIEKFKNSHTTFIHCVHANDNEFQKIKEIGGYISHCPVSNRLLNVGLLDLEKIKNCGIEYNVATDGLSSNYSLNLFKEIRAALLMHTTLHPKYLAKDLLKAVTINAAKSLNLNNGSLEKGKDADIITFKLPNSIKETENLPLQIILHTNKVDKLYINGKEV